MGVVDGLACNDIGLAFGWAKVRHGDVDSLWDDATIYFLADNDTDCTLVDVEDNTGAAVVVLERHTLVLRRINFNINIVTSLSKMHNK